jgi:hypothetical protein
VKGKVLLRPRAERLKTIEAERKAVAARAAAKLDILKRTGFPAVKPKPAPKPRGGPRR